jgi:hypothetical protein
MSTFGALFYYCLRAQVAEPEELVQNELSCISIHAGPRMVSDSFGLVAVPNHHHNTTTAYIQTIRSQ